MCLSLPLQPAQAVPEHCPKSLGIDFAVMSPLSSEITLKLRLGVIAR